MVTRAEKMTLSSNAHTWVEQALATMSLEEKVGQMLIVDFAAIFTNREHENWQRITRLIREQHIGGFILAGGSLHSIALLTNELQGLSKWPLLVNADMETGATFFQPWRRARGRAPDLPAFLSGGGTAFPPLMAIGATRSDEFAYEIGRLTALEARAIGIHWTNAPVLDINNNPRNPIINTRSFGEDPELVARLGAAFVAGTQASGVLATIKHFPGHGDTDSDTHIELPVLNLETNRLHAVELLPFKAAIKAGAKAAMTAHIAFPRFDASGRPATLSRKVVSELLRQELAFDGIVATDAFTMQGIADHFDPAEAAIMAAQAGVDALLIPVDTPKTHRRLVQAVRSGELPLQAVETAARRLLTMKAGLGLHELRIVDVNRIADLVNTPAAQQFAQNVASAAITLLEDDGAILPLPSDRPLKIVAGIISNSAAGNEGEHLAEQLAARTHEVASYLLSAGMSEALLAQALVQCREAEVVMFELHLTVGAWKGALRLPPQALQFLQAAREAHKPLIAISFGDPYMFEYLPPMSVSLCAYGGGRLMERAAALALLGDTAIQGKLPVTIPGRFAFGHGLQRA